MWTSSNISENAYVPYFKEADPKHLSRDSYGQRLVYGRRHIICGNDAYYLRDNKTEEVLESFPIRQLDGVDTEDRIEVLRNFIDLIRSA